MAEAKSDEVSTDGQSLVFRRSHQQGVVRGHITRIRALMLSDRASDIKKCEDQLLKLASSREGFVRIHLELIERSDEHELDLDEIQGKADILYKEVKNVYDEAQEWIVTMRTSIICGDRGDNISLEDTMLEQGETTVLKAQMRGSPLVGFFTPGAQEPSRVSGRSERPWRPEIQDHDDFETVLKSRESEIDALTRKVTEMQMRMDAMNQSHHRASMLEQQVEHQATEFRRVNVERDAEVARIQRELTRVSERENNARTSTPRSVSQPTRPVEPVNRTTFAQDDIFAISQAISGTNADMIQTMLDHSDRQRETFYSQMNVPVTPLQKFSGDSTKYFTFMKRFDEVVHSSKKNDASKLNTLIEHCSDEVRAHLDCCQYQSADVGYGLARDILRKRYGNPYIVSQAWVEKLMNYTKLSSAGLLTRFVGELASAHETLKALGFLSELECTRSMRMIVSKLPSYVQNRWRRIHRERIETETPARLKELIAVIREAAYEMSDPVYGPDSMLKLNSGEVKPRTVPVKKKVGSVEPADSYALQQTGGQFRSSGQTVRLAKYPCHMCKDERHYTYQCYMYKDLTPVERYDYVEKHELCYLCLGTGHRAAACDRNYACQYPGCRARHNTTMHRALLSRKKNSGQQINQASVEEVDEQMEQELTDDEDDREGLPVLVHDVIPVYNGGRYHGCYVLPTVPTICATAAGGTTSNALIDTGSTVTMCSRDLMEAMDAKPVARTTMLIQGINGDRLLKTDVIDFSIQGTDGSEAQDAISVIVNPEMTFSHKHARQLRKYKEWPHLQHLDIIPADHNTVELLLGQDNAHLFRTLDRIDGSDTFAPYGVQTPLGWTVFGNVTGKMQQFKPARGETNEVQVLENRTEDLLAKMWEIDQVPDYEPMSPINRGIVKKWKEEFKLVEGHVQLPLPFRKEPPALPNNRKPVLAQLNSLKKRFKRDPDLHQQYCRSMQVNLDKHYAEKAAEVPREGYENFVPQFPVIAENRPGKCRIVGNASYVFHNVSLNSALHQGPNFTGNLVEIILDFRVHPVVITGDIEQMFNQVHVPPNQRDALKFLWWPDGDIEKKEEEYQMTTQMFGLISSPSASMYAMREGVQRYGEDMDPETIQTALKNFYVDDLIKSIISVSVGIRLVRQLKEVLSRIGFNLTKFGSNRLEILEAIEEKDRAKPYQELEFALTESTTDKTLGLGWGPLRDVFLFMIKMATRPDTRRGVLSTFSSVFDPLGLVGPVILKAKVLIQQICRQGYEWDQELEPEIKQEWQDWKEDLVHLSGFSVPRWLQVEVEKPQEYSLHVFADACETGYGAVAYLTVKDEDSTEERSNLVMSKAKVAPISQMSIPRLELSAAVLAVKVAKIIERSVSLPLTRTVFWSDSTITLHYIHSQSRVFRTFVANRVAYVQDRTSQEQWRYVPGTLNVADVVSRGSSAGDLKDADIWLSGPSFLRSRELWPDMPDVFEEGQMSSKPEYRSDSARVNVVEYNYGLLDDRSNLVVDLIEYYSTWRRLIRAVAYWKKFIQFLKNKKKFKKQITAENFQMAEEVVVKTEQRCYIGKNKMNNTAFKKLFAFDDEGIIRVGGRLMMASIAYEEKYPAVLPPSKVAKLYVRHVHQRLGHPGIDRTYMETRKRFWIITGKRFVKRRVSKCVLCQRLRAKAAEQQMAPLPRYRVDHHTTPFCRVGIDFFGPIYVKLGRSTVKRYGCVITDLTTRCIHIEPVSDLSTSAFLQALQRFIARRGRPELIVSDNGTNFVGAHRELRALLKQWKTTKIENYMSEEGIEWRFNTPTASHHGGVWERQIRSVRTLLMAIVKTQSLSDETLHTYLCSVEQIINSRPLTKMSEDVTEELPLTPQHFFTLSRARAIPGQHSMAESLRRKWRQVEFMADQFWDKWLSSYLKDLQVRTKWNVPFTNFKVGDLVLQIRQDCGRMEWPLALITKIYPGVDGKVRSVGIKTKDGLYDRPIAKLIRLEFDE